MNAKSGGSSRKWGTSRTTGRQEEEEITKIWTNGSGERPPDRPPFVARLVEMNSSLLNACPKPNFGESEFGEFPERAISNRCKTERARKRVLSYVLEFYDFARPGATPPHRCPVRPPS